MSGGHTLVRPTLGRSFMKWISWLAVLLISCLICGCGSVSEKNLEISGDSATVEKTPLRRERPKKTLGTSGKKQSRSGVFCGDRNVSDDF